MGEEVKLLLALIYHLLTFSESHVLLRVSVQSTEEQVVVNLDVQSSSFYCVYLTYDCYGLAIYQPRALAFGCRWNSFVDQCGQFDSLRKLADMRKHGYYFA